MKVLTDDRSVAESAEWARGEGFRVVTAEGQVSASGIERHIRLLDSRVDAVVVDREFCSVEAVEQLAAAYSHIQFIIAGERKSEAQYVADRPRNITMLRDRAEMTGPTAGERLENMLSKVGGKAVKLTSEQGIPAVKSMINDGTIDTVGAVHPPYELGLEILSLAKAFPSVEFYVAGNLPLPPVESPAPSDPAAELMSAIRTQAEELQALTGLVEKYIAEESKRGYGTAEELDRLKEAQPSRWLAIARTDLQTGLMALRRAVQQPDEF